MRCLVIIPAYNEEATIERVVRLSQQHADVCVVDDGSKDRTPEILAHLPGVHCIRHDKNTHIPGAVLDGMRYACDAGYDFCITMDAGLSHDPNAIPQFLAHANADLVIGYREKKVRVPGYRKVLSWGGTLLMNFALDPRKAVTRRGWLQDATSGFRMYSRKAVALLLHAKMKSRSFDFHLEALAHVYRNGLRIKEIPIVYVHSNSSLRWKVVGHALETWSRILFSEDFRPSATP